MSATATRLPLVLSLIAIVLGGGLIAQAFTSQNTINSLNDKLNSLTGRVDTAEAGKTQNLKLIVGEGKLTNASAMPEDVASVEYHRWEPAVLVVNKGDTVNLNVTNLRRHPHSFLMTEGYALNSGPLIKNQSWTTTFVADKAGVFQFICGVSYDPGDPNDPNDDKCDPDHGTIVGYLVVLA